MKSLTVVYDGRTVFDSEVHEFSWAESDSELVARAFTKPRPAVAQPQPQQLSMSDIRALISAFNANGQSVGTL